MKIVRPWLVTVFLCSALIQSGAGGVGSTGDTPAAIAEGHSGAWISLRDGQPLRKSGRGAVGRPLSLDAADVSGDGLPDLIAGYSGSMGGRLVIHRANLDTRAPFDSRVRLRKATGEFLPEPFLPDPHLISLPISPDLLGSGDFNGDDLVDLVVGELGGSELWWLPGTAAGSFRNSRSIALPGTLMALVTGDVDRGDGRDDIVVATLSAGSSQVLLLREKEEGAFARHALLSDPNPVDALALGRLDRDKGVDLAVAAGESLDLILGDDSGRFDHRLTVRVALGGTVRAVAFGEFDDGAHHGPGLAILSSQGELHIARIDAGVVTLGPLGELPVEFGTADSLVALNLSNRPGDDLLLGCAESRQLAIRVGGLRHDEWVALETDVGPVAVLPMHLNADPFSDIVILLGERDEPVHLLTTASQIHAVDSILDDPDADPFDGICATGSGECTLRAAIEQANAAAGTDAIRFDIPGAGPHTIQPLSVLPAIADTVLIDATTEPDYTGTPVVEIDGSLAGNTDGLFLIAGASSIRGLAINRFELTAIAIVGPQAIDSRVQANFLGTDVSGSADLGNLSNGVYIDQGRGTIVGTDGDGVADRSEGNLISGNSDNGVIIIGDGATDNAVAGNWIGTDVGGTAALPNDQVGVVVINGPTDNRIGTDGDGLADAEERNVISGNIGQGILVAGAGSTIIAGNLIGTDVSGETELGNQSAGIELSNGARFNRVGSDADGLSDDLERNVISGNAENGIVTFGDPPTESNTIAGNYIGVDAAGAAALANQGDGIYLGDVSTTLVGGSLPEARNVISGNGGSGIYVWGTTGTENRIQGNYIGTDATGTYNLGNAGDGVAVSDASTLVIGIDGDGIGDDTEGNLISGNGFNGINFWGTLGGGHRVKGNLVGTDVTGSLAMGNAVSGIALGDSVGSLIGTDGDGTSDDLEGNVLSANGHQGLLIYGSNANNNVVAGNRIGSDATGSAALPNAVVGLEVSNGPRFTRIGTNNDGISDALERNIISGNNGMGVTMFGSPPVEDSRIAGNYIGLQADGISPLGNTIHGIHLDGANRTLIGGLGVTPGSCDGPCNHIAYNGTGQSRDGIRIVIGTEDAVVGNWIHDSNGGAAIDIATAGMSPNDPDDLDGDSNNGQNYPRLIQAVTEGGTTTVDGLLDSLPSTDYHLEFFANAACDPNGYGEAETLWGVHDLTTDGNGDATFSVALSPPVPAGHRLCATATRMAGAVPTDTSELSSCLALGPATAAGRVPDGDLQPGTPLTISLDANQAYVNLAWGSSCMAGDVDYEIYVGTIGDFTSHLPRRCSTEGLTNHRLRITSTDHYFLVVPKSGNREGSYGFDSDGFERAPGADACHLQSIGSCP